MAAVRHLGFSKTWFLSTGSPWAADFPSGYKIWWKNVDRRQNYGPKSKSKMWPNDSSAIIGPHRPVKFYANPMHSFEDMTIWIFCWFGLKCLFTPQKFCFGGLNPWTWLVIIETHKRHTLGRNRTYRSMPILVQIGPLVRPVRETWNQKKRKKARKETYSGKLGVRPDHPRWYVVLHAGWSSGGSSKFQVSSKSDEPIQWRRCHQIKYPPSKVIPFLK